MILKEGGNVFKVDGKPVTQRINLADIQPTIAYLEKITGLPLSNNMLAVSYTHLTLPTIYSV